MPFQWLETSTANTLELTPFSFTTKLEVDFAVLLESLEGKMGKWSQRGVNMLQVGVVYDQLERWLCKKFFIGGFLVMWVYQQERFLTFLHHATLFKLQKCCQYVVCVDSS